MEMSFKISQDLGSFKCVNDIIDGCDYVTDGCDYITQGNIHTIITIQSMILGNVQLLCHFPVCIKDLCGLNFFLLLLIFLFWLSSLCSIY